MVVSPLRLDPTQTIKLVGDFVAVMRAKCNALIAAVEKLVGEEDVFGLGEGTDQPLGPVGNVLVRNRARWQFATDPQKIAAYQAWLKVQTDAGILEAKGHSQTPWTAEWIESSYKKAVVRAYTNVHPETLSPMGEDYDATRQQFLEDTFASPITAKRLELLYSRSFDKLKEYTAVMASQTSVILADGLAHGVGSRVLGRRMAKAMDTLTKRRALTIARTEMANAYAEGSLDTYERLGIDELKVLAEWSTAGDGKVCPMCRPLEGVLLTVKEARGLLPRHPNCRCAWLPANVGETPKGQFWNAETAAQRMGDSMRAETGETSLAAARADSGWAGADVHPSDKSALKPTKAKRDEIQRAYLAQIAADKAADEAAWQAEVQVTKQATEYKPWEDPLLAPGKDRTAAEWDEVFGKLGAGATPGTRNRAHAIGSTEVDARDPASTRRNYAHEVGHHVANFSLTKDQKEAWRAFSADAWAQQTNAQRERGGGFASSNDPDEDFGMAFEAWFVPDHPDLPGPNKLTPKQQAFMTSTFGTPRRMAMPDALEAMVAEYDKQIARAKEMAERAARKAKEEAERKAAEDWRKRQVQIAVQTGGIADDVEANGQLNREAVRRMFIAEGLQAVPGDLTDAMRQKDAEAQLAWVRQLVKDRREAELKAADRKAKEQAAAEAAAKQNTLNQLRQRVTEQRQKVEDTGVHLMGSLSTSEQTLVSFEIDALPEQRDATGFRILPARQVFKAGIPTELEKPENGHTRKGVKVKLTNLVLPVENIDVHLIHAAAHHATDGDIVVVKKDGVLFVQSGHAQLAAQKLAGRSVARVRYAEWDDATGTYKQAADLKPPSVANPKKPKPKVVPKDPFGVPLPDPWMPPNNTKNKAGAKLRAELLAKGMTPNTADRLDVKDEGHPEVRAKLEKIAQMPAHHQEIAVRGAGNVYVGKGGVPDLDDKGHLKGVQPRGHSPGSKWDDLDGGGPGSRGGGVILGTNGASGYCETAWHEMAHGIDKGLNPVGVSGGWTSTTEGREHPEFKALQAIIRREGGPYADYPEEAFAMGYEAYMRLKLGHTKPGETDWSSHWLRHVSKEEAEQITAFFDKLLPPPKP